MFNILCNPLQRITTMNTYKNKIDNKSTINSTTLSKKKYSGKLVIPELKYEQPELVKHLGGTAKDILQYINYKIDHSSAEGVTIDEMKAYNLTYNQLSKALGYSKKTIEHTIRKMEKLGIIIFRHAESFCRWVGKSYQINKRKLYEILGIPWAKDSPPPPPNIGRRPPENGSINTKALTKIKKIKIKKEISDDQGINPSFAADGATDLLPGSQLIVEKKVVFSDIKYQLKRTLPSNVFKSWFEKASIPKPTNGLTIITVDSNFLVTYITTNFMDVLNKIIGKDNFEVVCKQRIK